MTVRNMGETTQVLQGILWMGLASLLWALIEMLGWHVPKGYSPYQTVWVRYATHLLFMVSVLGPRYRGALVRTRRPQMQVCRSLLMLGMPACFIAAVARMPAGAVWRIFWVSPVLVAVLSWGWLRERVRAHHWLAVGVGLAGSLLLSNAGEDVVRREVILPLGMAACFSVYQVMTRAMREETAMANLFYTALFVLLPLTLGLPGFWRALTREAAAWMGAIGLVGLLGLLALERALHLAPASVVAPFVYLQPVWMAFLGGLLLGRHVERRQVAGACAVLGSGVYAILRERQIRLRQVWPGAEHGWPAAGTAPRRPDAGLPR